MEWIPFDKELDDELIEKAKNCADIFVYIVPKGKRIKPFISRGFFDSQYNKIIVPIALPLGREATDEKLKMTHWMPVTKPVGIK